MGFRPALLAAKRWHPDVLAGLGATEATERRPKLGIDGTYLRLPVRMPTGLERGWTARLVDGTGPKWLHSKGETACPYEAWRTFAPTLAGGLLVCEGASDAVSLLHAFPDARIVASLGASWRWEWGYCWGDEALTARWGGDGVTVVADNDEAGERLRAAVAERCAVVRQRCRQLRVPEPHGDVGEWWAAVTDDEFRRQWWLALAAAAA